MKKNPRNIPNYSDGQYPNSYYAASRNDTKQREKLKNDIKTDICVIGAGYTGLSTALALTESDREVVVLDGARIGWGASGRNGGQIVNGLNASLKNVKKTYGDSTAKFIGERVTRGNEIIRRYIKNYQIDCDLTEKNAYVAYTNKHMAELRAKKALWESYGMTSHEMLDKEALQQYVNSPVYVGGMVDHSGAHIHPLNLALGEARAIEKNGGKIYEETLVTDIKTENDHVMVYTEEGSVKANQVVICGNAYLNKVIPELTDRILPASTQVVATEPLQNLADQLIPSNICIEDARYILDYYRLSSDKRMIFGGGTIYGGTDPVNIESKIRPNMEKVFPQLKDVKIDYAWSGNFAISFSRIPQMGMLNDKVLFAHGYSGHGVTGTHLFGNILADKINGKGDEFEIFQKIPWFRFPGGRRFRVQYSAAGSWWYGLRDKLGL